MIFECILCFIVLWLAVGWVVNRCFHQDELKENESDECPYE